MTPEQRILRYLRINPNRRFKPEQLTIVSQRDLMTTRKLLKTMAEKGAIKAGGEDVYGVYWVEAPSHDEPDFDNPCIFVQVRDSRAPRCRVKLVRDGVNLEYHVRTGTNTYTNVPMWITFEEDDRALHLFDGQAWSAETLYIITHEYLDKLEVKS